MNSFKRFSEEKLPDKRKCFSSSKDQCISEKDYLHVINVFKMNTMGDYHDLYLKTDVLLLADVFEKFINSIDGYRLEVDLEYPDELHELHNNYPLALEKLKLVKIFCQIIVVILQMTKE